VYVLVANSSVAVVYHVEVEMVAAALRGEERARLTSISGRGIGREGVL
jgi:hypothetical protein